MQLRTVQHRPIVVGAVHLTPESQVLAVRLPFGRLRFSWHRPTAVVVERNGQQSQRLPILDLTRAVQLGVLLGTLVLTAVWLSIISERALP
jgi:hypothetical protein